MKVYKHNRHNHHNHNNRSSAPEIDYTHLNRREERIVSGTRDDNFIKRSNFDNQQCPFLINPDRKTIEQTHTVKKVVINTTTTTTTTTTCIYPSLPEDPIAAIEVVPQAEEPSDIPEFIEVPNFTEVFINLPKSPPQTKAFENTCCDQYDQKPSAHFVNNDPYHPLAVVKGLESNHPTESTTAGATPFNCTTTDILDLSYLPELQYSGSFNSKSTKSKNSVSFADQDYSEENRLLLIASQSDISLRRNNSECNEDEVHVTELQQPNYYHRPSLSSSLGNNNYNMNNLSAHANLGDLLNARKNNQQAQRESGINKSGAGSSGLTKPTSLANRSKAKTTGTITHQQQNPNNYDSILLTSSGSLLEGRQPSQYHPQLQSHQSPMRPTNNGSTRRLPDNPFEVSNLMGDLPSSSYSNQIFTKQSTPSTGNVTTQQQPHPLHSFHHSSSMPLQNNNNNDSLAQFDPLNSPSFSQNNQSMLMDVKQQQQRRHHQPRTNSIDTSQLSELAAALSSLRPQQQTHNNNDVHNKNCVHQVTLGQVPKDSTGTNKSHRRFLSLRSSKSLTADELGMITDAVEGAGNSFESFVDLNSINIDSKDSKEKKHRRAGSLGIFKRNSNDGNEINRPKTPIKKLLRNKNNNSGNSSPNPYTGIKDEEEDTKATAATPGRLKSALRLGKNHSRNDSISNNIVLAKLSQTGISPDHSPTRGKKIPLEPIQSNDSDQSKSLHADLSGSPKTEIKLRSSEHDPSPHQVSIPPVTDVIMQAKLCQVMEMYREVDQNFDFSALVNVSRYDMEMFVERKPKSPPRASSTGSNNLSPPQGDMFQSISPMSSMPSPSLMNLVPAHKPIVESVINIASDLVVSAFYHEVCQIENPITHDTTHEKCPGDRTEVAIFASDELRQFIVVYQGSCENQAKPIRNRLGKFKSKCEKNFGEDEEALTVFPPFEQAYCQCGIEEKVFQKLDELAEQHPFFDVIVTGHSYGAMLALIGSMRYACSRSAMMVSCYAFGCPKVGALDFRYYVNSLPNLKVMRVEYGCDPWVHTPEHLTHAGHTISITLQQQSNKERKAGGEKLTKDEPSPQNELLVRAYKFGNDRPDSASNGKYIGKKGNRQEKQIDHDLSSYLNAIEIVAKDAFAWPQQFVGEEGRGVQGLDSEKRLVC